ncbi:hypothetical protein CPU12_09130 [Malaciobacter molluscorum LMG 25693]|uniref:Uncharacterized protein n=1 Tax=Malaciobacter molluscorum LMG 25693 TaxID=870501 RepID=A0A2G1DGX7_9BACT|nr:hypothetical protein [Malaciobacter molluscorum]AXX92268.1 hypothetical protein AMOL_1292 [Malaciobacter molluscorum LMG 25693]PHO17745.1 hypothetical protein CPU12_09130 [Malaciobacter molluscorum LMG 25693]
MNIGKLRDLESEFYDQYPKGFKDERLLCLLKKFNPEKLEEVAKNYFQKENFSQPQLICEGFMKVISRSPMVSLFDKAKLRDALKSMDIYQKDMLSIELYELIYGNKKNGFNGLVEFLKEYNLAKWTLVTLIPYALKRKKEYFIKPTTTKMIINFLELENLIYKPKPSYEFYKSYSKVLSVLKKDLKKPVLLDNAAFTGFLKMGIEICEED